MQQATTAKGTVTTPAPHAAGSPTTNAMFATDDLEISGTLTTTSYIADSGNTLRLIFDPANFVQCGVRPFDGIGRGVLDCAGDAFALVECAPGVTPDDIVAATDAPVVFSRP